MTTLMCHSLQETYEQKRLEHVREMQAKEERMRQMFVQKVGMLSCVLCVVCGVMCAMWCDVCYVMVLGIFIVLGLMWYLFTGQG